MSNNYNALDDKLIDRIGQELARIGLMVPISEIEATILKCYDEIREAHSLAPNNVTVDAYIKDDKYYGIMTCVVCANIIARARLQSAKDGYEATAVLAILQKYLDNLSVIAGTERQQAPLIFSDIIQKLEIDLVIDGNSAGGWTAKVPREKGGSSEGVTNEDNISAQPKINPHNTSSFHTGPSLPGVINILPHHKVFIEAFMTAPKRITEEEQQSQKRFEPRVCSNCNHAICGECQGCGNCDELECGPDITVTVNYHGMCFGFRIDPGVVGVERASYTEDELKECRGALKHAILRAGRILSKKSNEMFAAFNKRYLEDEED